MRTQLNNLFARSSKTFRDILERLLTLLAPGNGTDEKEPTIGFRALTQKLSGSRYDSHPADE